MLISLAPVREGMASADLSIFALVPSAFFPILLIVLLAIAAMILWLIWQRRLDSFSPVSASSLAEHTTVVPRPIFTQEEAHLFNLIQLVVHDMYLVFGKLPLLSLVNIIDPDEVSRQTIVRTLRPVRADVVLVNPGTRLPTKVIFFAPSGTSHSQRTDQDRLVEAVLKAAHIERFVLTPANRWTVPQLADVLGLQEEQ